jgi:molecular chaperone GrpE (heat shock protein)
MARLSEHLRRQADRYRQIARNASDPEVAEALLAIVDELEAALDAIEGDGEFAAIASAAVH